MWRKIILLFLLFIPFIVKAENVSIISIKIIENNTSQETIEEPTINGLNIDFKLKFTNLNESIKYKVIITNDSDKDYDIKNETKFSDKEYIKYELLYANNATKLKAKSSQELIIIVTYNQEIPYEAFTDGYYIDNNDLSLQLVNNTVNPKTKKIGLPLIIMISIASLSFIFLIIMSIKKHSLAMLLIALLLIPITIYALETITITVKATVEIENKEDEFELRLYGCTSSSNGKRFIRYNKTMTMAQFYNSSYFEQLDPDLKYDLTHRMYPDLYNHDAEVCLNGGYNDGDMSRLYDCATYGRLIQVNYEEELITNANNGVYIIKAAC